MGRFKLKCLKCGREYDQEHRLTCENDDSFLRTEYFEKKLELRNQPGIGRFHSWLPVQEELITDAGPITYKSEAFARELGLSNLYIGFSGYWPERSAFIKTCSFKELEAYPTMQLLKETGGKAIVLASAGNTGRAFAHVSALTGIDVYIVVPDSGISSLWLPEEPTESIHLIRMSPGNDYTDAINLAGRIAKLPGMVPEGGARNVARRDGMGTVMLDAAVTIGRIPDHYFQAVGSGTGGISAWEASIRLRDDGRFGQKLAKLQLSQNLPFVPMYNAWQERRRDIIPELDMKNAKKQIEETYATVLTNRAPPYGVTGGLYDALVDTDGIMYAVTKEEALEAKSLFESLEGIDILSPSAVAVASLLKAVEAGKVSRDDTILLNVAGGGYKRLKEDFNLSQVPPVATATDPDMPLEELNI
ncbi:cysteate synthase [Methanosarcina thermophila]|jgi:cysteate synthase|nr:cysteate synthase [Methanosarcina thermophila]ALK06464.1 MAG: cysteate synthase [Methanosarcina sp. 795]AKB11872.1 Cysteate synthase [Methanosarcina thermophila TM-1]AKB14932.1 Cysteate synthase [Methanosarcina thermophila CHTI-55]NLU55875.1 cysteate synthase [Methanosarcina thermophila]SFT59484.1 cysteate synthase [Methanosarcina thermophila]